MPGLEPAQVGHLVAVGRRLRKRIWILIAAAAVSVGVPIAVSAALSQGSRLAGIAVQRHGSGAQVLAGATVAGLERGRWTLLRIRRSRQSPEMPQPGGPGMSY